MSLYSLFSRFFLRHLFGSDCSRMTFAVAIHLFDYLLCRALKVCLVTHDMFLLMALIWGPHFVTATIDIHLRMGQMWPEPQPMCLLFVFPDSNPSKCLANWWSDLWLSLINHCHSGPGGHLLWLLRWLSAMKQLAMGKTKGNTSTAAVMLFCCMMLYIVLRLIS